MNTFRALSVPSFPLYLILPFENKRCDRLTRLTPEQPFTLNHGFKRNAKDHEQARHKALRHERGDVDGVPGDRSYGAGQILGHEQVGSGC